VEEATGKKEEEEEEEAARWIRRRSLMVTALASPPHPPLAPDMRPTMAEEGGRRERACRSLGEAVGGKERESQEWGRTGRVPHFAAGVATSARAATVSTFLKFCAKGWV
jgi:hypothetical protein